MKPAETFARNHDGRVFAPTLSGNRVLRNTYWLLSLTFLFSAGATSLLHLLGIAVSGEG